MSVSEIHNLIAGLSDADHAELLNILPQTERAQLTERRKLSKAFSSWHKAKENSVLGTVKNSTAKELQGLAKFPQAQWLHFCNSGFSNDVHVLIAGPGLSSLPPTAANFDENVGRALLRHTITAIVMALMPLPRRDPELMKAGAIAACEAFGLCPFEEEDSLSDDGEWRADIDRQERDKIPATEPSASAAEGGPSSSAEARRGTTTTNMRRSYGRATREAALDADIERARQPGEQERAAAAAAERTRQQGEQERATAAAAAEHTRQQGEQERAAAAAAAERARQQGEQERATATAAERTRQQGEQERATATAAAAERTRQQGEQERAAATAAERAPQPGEQERATAAAAAEQARQPGEQERAAAAVAAERASQQGDQDDPAAAANAERARNQDELGGLATASVMAGSASTSTAAQQRRDLSGGCTTALDTGHQRRTRSGRQRLGQHLEPDPGQLDDADVSHHPADHGQVARRGQRAGRSSGQRGRGARVPPPLDQQDLCPSVEQSGSAVGTDGALACRPKRSVASKYRR